MYFRLVDRHAKPDEYIFIKYVDDQIVKVNGVTMDGGAVYNEKYDDYYGVYHAEIAGPDDYMVLELVE